MMGSQSDHDPLAWLEAERANPGASRMEFRRQLEDCTALLVRAGAQVGAAVLPVTRAFLEADTHRAARAITDDTNVQSTCRRIEDACYVLLARQAPVARDLRQVVATLTSVADVQRAADLLRHVAESLQWVHPPSMPGDVRTTIAQLGELSGEILSAGVQAWADHDPLAANELRDADDQVDLLQKVLLTEIYTGERSVEESVTLALIARYFERISDHGVELARQVSFFVTGERVAASHHDAV